MVKLEIIRDAGIITSPHNLASLLKKQQARSLTGTVLLRGLNDDTFRLVPQAGRQCVFADRVIEFDTEREQMLLRRFRHYASQLVDHEITVWETIFLAHRHGLPVRLLEWTTNPSAALYFACEYRESSQFGTGQLPNARIWMLVPRARRDNRFPVVSSEHNPHHLKGIRLVHALTASSQTNPRGGFFTIQQDPRTALDENEDLEYDESCLDIVRLVSYVVPREKRAEWLQELYDRGVSRSTLVSTLDGLAAGLLAGQAL